MRRHLGHRCLRRPAAGTGSSSGAFFDNFCGGYTDAAVFCGLIAAGLCEPLWGALAIVGTLMRMISFRVPVAAARAVGEAPHTPFPYALAGKGDPIVIIAAGALWGWLPESVIVVAVLTNAIAVARTMRAYRVFREAAPGFTPVPAE